MQKSKLAEQRLLGHLVAGLADKARSDGEAKGIIASVHGDLEIIVRPRKDERLTVFMGMEIRCKEDGVYCDGTKISVVIPTKAIQQTYPPLLSCAG